MSSAVRRRGRLVVTLAAQLGLLALAGHWITLQTVHPYQPFSRSASRADGHEETFHGYPGAWQSYRRYVHEEFGTLRPGERPDDPFEHTWHTIPEGYRFRHRRVVGTWPAVGDSPPKQVTSAEYVSDIHRPGRNLAVPVLMAALAVGLPVAAADAAARRAGGPGRGVRFVRVAVVGAAVGLAAAWTDFELDGWQPTPFAGRPPGLWLGGSRTYQKCRYLAVVRRRELLDYAGVRFQTVDDVWPYRARLTISTAAAAALAGLALFRPWRPAAGATAPAGAAGSPGAPGPPA